MIQIPTAINTPAGTLTFLRACSLFVLQMSYAASHISIKLELVPIFKRCHSVRFTKTSVEGCQRRKTARYGNLGDAFIFFTCQQLLRVADSIKIQ